MREGNALSQMEPRSPVRLTQSRWQTPKHLATTDPPPTTSTRDPRSFQLDIPLQPAWVMGTCVAEAVVTPVGVLPVDLATVLAPVLMQRTEAECDGEGSGLNAVGRV